MFTACDLQNMRNAQYEHMQDMCSILAYTAGTANEYNEQDAPTYPVQSVTVCGFDMRAGIEKRSADMTPIDYDATLRLPIGTQITELDRVQITARYAEFPDALTFEIVSPIQRGASGIRLLLRKVVV